MSCARGGSQSAPGTPMRGITTPTAGRSCSGQCHASRLEISVYVVAACSSTVSLLSLHAVREALISVCLRHTRAW